MPNRQIVLASHNAGKLAELQTLLDPLGLQLLALPKISAVAPDETGKTFVENALIKARAAATLTGLPAIADDSGICVSALGGAPGVYSARFAGAAASDADNNRLLLQHMHDVPPEARGAEFVCVLVYLRGANDPTPLIATGTWRGVIATSPRGAAGFGYDPLFFVPALGMTSAELAREQKNVLSHRGIAARGLVAQLAMALPT